MIKQQLNDLNSDEKLFTTNWIIKWMKTLSKVVLVTDRWKMYLPHDCCQPKRVFAWPRHYKFVVARLRGLRTVAPWTEGHTRLVVNKLKLQTKTSHIYITLFSLFVCKSYVVLTYQPHAHICNSCKRYVVVTYRFITFTSCKKNVFYTCNSGELIGIGTEQLRNKRIFIYFPYFIFISLSGATFLN